jgi:DNA-binding NarL/FixJ family response regulator
MGIEGSSVFLSYSSSVLLDDSASRRAIRLFVYKMEKTHVHFRILLADDHPTFRHMLRLFLEHNPNWEVCGEAADGLEAVVRTGELHPDIVLMDLSMPNLNGIDATRKIRSLSPSTRILILTFHELPALQEIARNSGAQGYVLKSEPFDVLKHAIEQVCTSESGFVSPRHN